MDSQPTRFGSLDDFEPGTVQIIDDDPKNYVFSNIFAVAAKSAPYERIAVAKNFQYVIEAMRAEGTSPWFSCAHDEFALAMDGEVEVRLVKLERPAQFVPADSQGAHRLPVDMPEGRKMGRIVLRQGHMGLLPKGSAYRFHSPKAAAVMLQTIEGPLTVQKWAEICQTAA